MNESGPANRIQKSEPTLFDFMLAFEKKRNGGKLLCENQKLSGSFLRENDTLVVESVESEDAKGSFVYKITETTWPDLSINDYEPSQIIFGHLEGALVPDELAKQDLHMSGSGWGDSSRRINTIEPEAHLYLTGISGEFMMPPTRDYAIARKNNNGILEILKPNELGVPNKNIEKNQNAYIGQILLLMKKFGFEQFDFLECKKGVGPVGSPEQAKEYEDKTFLAHYSQGRADGNEFFVFNKNTRQMVACKYFNFDDENMLQIAYADLTDSKEVRPEEDHTMGLSIRGMYRACVPIVTFTSSPELDLETVSYHAGDVEAMEYLKIPKIGNVNNFVSVPDIQLWPNNNVKVVAKGYLFNDIERENPGTLERIKKMINATSFPDGRHIFQLGERKIKIKNLDDILTETRRPEPTT